MRRFLAFAMCVSGFTLAVSWTRAAEPLVAASADEAEPAAETAPDRPAEPADPPSRPVVTRTEPGSRPDDADRGDRTGKWRRDLLQRFDELRAAYVTPEFIEKQQQRLEQLQEALEHSADRYSGESLEIARRTYEAQISRIEEMLEKVIQQRENADRQVQRAAAEGRSADDDSTSDGPPDRIRERRRGEPADDEDRPAASGPGSTERLEARLQQLRQAAEELAESGEAEAREARQEIENQIDKLERFLAARRERREAAERAPDRPPGDNQELQQRLRHIHAAIEHLEAAGMQDMAANLRQHADQLSHEAEMRRATLEAARTMRQQQDQMARHMAELQQRRQAAAEAEAAAAQVPAIEAPPPDPAAAAEPAGVSELAEQLRDLRRELRKLRQEVQEVREAQAEPRDK